MPGTLGCSKFSWKLIPWLAGVALAPILFGSVDSLQQGIVGSLFGISFFLLILQLRGDHLKVGSVSYLWGILLLFGTLIPLIPLPIGLVSVVSPERVNLARLFPALTGDSIKWLTLTISPAATMRRSWEVALLVACFYLARFAGRCRTDRILALSLCASLFVLSASDIWYRLYGSGKLLGIWEDSAHHAAGTFANRNHFANWIYVASLFVLGWIIGRFALRRRERDSGTTTFRWGEMVLASAIVLVAIFMAVFSGSRAGLIAGFCGLVGAGFLVKSAARSRQVRLSFVFITVALALIFIFGGGYILHRFASDGGLDFKVSIWRDAWRIVQKFPITGTGPGTFERAFSHYKTFGPHSTFLYAENDIIQSFVESGLVFSALFFLLISLSVMNLFRYARQAEAGTGMVMIGGLAALITFFVHSLFEFVFQITATALLATALFGYLSGMRDRATGPVLVPRPGGIRIVLNLVFALGILTLSGFHILGWHYLRVGEKTKLSSSIAASLQLWPGSTDAIFAYIPLALEELGRKALSTGPGKREVNPDVERAIRLDPLNWRLRYEAFPLRARELPDDARNEAWRIIRLNPLQPALPLSFAREFNKRDRDGAQQFLKAAVAFPENLNSVLDVAWEMDPSPNSLWKSVPGSDAGLDALGYFALGKSLTGMAVTAFQRISDAQPVEKRAENFLNAGRPDLALRILSGASSREGFLRSRAYFQLGLFPDAIHAAEQVWTERGFESQIARDISKGRTNAQAREALSTADMLMKSSPSERDLAGLKQLAETSHLIPILRMVFETERERGHYEEAAKIALQLAGEALK